MKSRKIIAVVLAAALAASLCACGKKQETPVFSDVGKGAWYAGYVNEAAESGIVLGYDDGTYQADKYITAGEFVKMLAKANGADPQKFEARHWAFVYWEYLDEYGVFEKSRVTDLRTCLDAAITRQEASLVIYNAMVDIMGEEITATDDPAANIPGFISLDKQYLMPVAQLYAKGILSGYGNLSFYGSAYLTRGEAAALVVRLFDKSKRSVAAPSYDKKYESLGKFSSSTLFIGDELTYQLVENYLIPNNVIGSASYMAAPCTTVKYFTSNYWLLTPSEDNRYGVACSREFEDLSFGGALGVGKGKYKTVYFLLGSNKSSYVTKNQFVDAIELVQKNNPGAVIYVCTVPDSPNGAVASDRVNGIIREAVQKMNAAGSANVKLLDTNSAWNAACIDSDGIHLTQMGLDAWYRYICAKGTL
jgi:hypothetical protein